MGADGEEAARLRLEYEEQLRQLKALGVTELPPPPPDLDALGPADEGASEALGRILAEQNASAVLPRWEVVGGADRGGILVRAGCDLASPQLPERLATGAEVEELELVGERLHFKKLAGAGPEEGWASIRLKGKELLAPLGGDKRDLDGRSLGPWQAHGDRVTAVLFDRHRCPPGEARTLYSCCWMEAEVKAWDLSGKAPKGLGALSTRGLVAGLALTPRGQLLAAVSANPLPQTGSVCHQADFKQRQAERDDALSPSDTLLAWDLEDRPFQRGLKPRGLELHRRGCHAVAFGAESGLVASLSSDCLAVCRPGAAGANSLWKAPDPHGPEGQARHLCWLGADKLWTADKAGGLKLWDAARGAQVAEASNSWHSFAQLAAQPAAQLLLAATEDGVALFDARSSRMLRTQFTKEPVGAVAVLPGEGSADFFAGVGKSVVQYEARVAGGAVDGKSRAVGVWELTAKVSALDCLRSGAGRLLVGAGCQDGQVAAFDAS